MDNKLHAGDILKKTGDFISDNKKPILYVIGAVVVVGVGISIVKGAKEGVFGMFTPNWKGAGNFTELTVNPSNATITAETAKIYANQLYQAMAKAGTNENTIKAILKNINGEDYRMIYNAFSLRTYFLEGAPTLLAYIMPTQDLDLNSWFKKEISSISDYITYDLIKTRSKEAGLAF